MKVKYPTPDMTNSRNFTSGSGADVKIITSELTELPEFKGFKYEVQRISNSDICTMFTIPEANPLSFTSSRFGKLSRLIELITSDRNQHIPKNLNKIEVDETEEVP